MIRKAVIVVLTLGAMATALLLIADFSDVSYGRGHTGKVTSSLALICRDGSLRVVRKQVCGQENPPSQSGLRLWPFFAKTSYLDHRVQQLHHDSESGRIASTVYQLNLRPTLLLLLAYPVIALFRGPLRRHRLRQHGLCVNCGYDLTGNVSGLCSECGNEI